MHTQMTVTHFSPVSPSECRARKSANRHSSDDGFVFIKARDMPRREYNRINKTAHKRRFDD